MAKSIKSLPAVKGLSKCGVAKCDQYLDVTLFMMIKNKCYFSCCREKSVRRSASTMAKGTGGDVEGLPCDSAG